MGWITSIISSSSLELLPWLAFCAIVIGFAHSAYVALAGPLSDIPAIHWLARWSRYYNLYIKYFYSTRTAHYQAHLRMDKNSSVHPIVRVGPNEVSIMNTEGIKTVWGGGFERSPWYAVFSNFGKPNMFSSTSSRAHSSRKRIFASSYSKTSVAGDRVQSIIKSRVAKIMSFLERQSSSNSTFHGSSGPVVIRNVFRALQADVFTAFAFAEGEGTDFLNHLEMGPNTVEDLGMGMMDLFHDEKRDEFFFWESERPFKYIGKLLARNGPKSHERAQRWLMELLKPHEARLRSTDPIKSAEKGLRQFNGGVYEKLMFYKNPETGNPLDWTERASEIMDHAVAGQDAVPAALEFIIRQISTHPHVQAKLRLELLTSVPLVAEDRSFAMIDTLSYLNAVIMEGLRLVDTISSYQTRVVPKGGCVISDHYLPAGTIVAAQPYLINRQPDVFPDPETFNPSRWLLPREDYRNLAKSMWTYSSGPRSCVGRELSLAIIKTVVADTYIRYKTTLLDPDRTEKRPWEGADFMAEVRFESILACEDGEWIENRVRKPSLFPVEAHEQVQEPVRRSSVFHPSFENKASGEDKIQEAVVNPSERQRPVNVQFNLNSFTKGYEAANPNTTTQQRAPGDEQENDNINNQIIPPHQNLDAQAWLEQHYSPRKPSLVPSLLPLPLGAQGQKGGEQREDILRRPSVMHMYEADEEIAPLKQPAGKVSRPRRPGLGRMRTAPERVDGVLQGI